MSGKREYGDYQTPDSFALSVCEYLKEKRGINPAVVIEPTCGTGSFIKNSLIFVSMLYSPLYNKICNL